jgi:hypothetical protein
LGEFSPDGRSFTFGSFIKITYKSSPKCWATVPPSIDYVLIVTKNWLGYDFLQTHLVNLIAVIGGDSIVQK